VSAWRRCAATRCLLLGAIVIHADANASWWTHLYRSGTPEGTDCGKEVGRLRGTASDSALRHVHKLNGLNVHGFRELQAITS
jgi:hypothetical protein